MRFNSRVLVPHRGEAVDLLRENAVEHAGPGIAEQSLILRSRASIGNADRGVGLGGEGNAACCSTYCRQVRT